MRADVRNRHTHATNVEVKRLCRGDSAFIKASRAVREKEPEGRVPPRIDAINDWAARATNSCDHERCVCARARARVACVRVCVCACVRA